MIDMPTYEYECEACEHGFEEFQSMSEPPLTKCPKCGKKKLRRLFGTGAAVLFKGSGFYETDYRSESYKKAAKADQEAGKTAEAGTDGAAGANGKSDAPTKAPAAQGKKKSGAKTSKSGD
jgi:putative FmdB family regulatory protein